MYFSPIVVRKLKIKILRNLLIEHSKKKKLFPQNEITKVNVFYQLSYDR